MPSTACPELAERPAPKRRRGSPSRARRGAPKGNLNALKSGKRSKQPCPERSRRVKRLIFALMADPGTRRVLLALRKMDQCRTARLEEAINHYAMLLQTRPERSRREPSRERSIRSVHPRAILGAAGFRETNTIRPPSAPALPGGVGRRPPPAPRPVGEE